MFIQSPKNINSETFSPQNTERKYRKIKLNPNFFTLRIKKENNKNGNKNKLASLDVENLFMYNKINNITSIYQTKNFEKDFEKSRIYKTNICKLPKINFKKYIKPSNFRLTPRKLFSLNLDNYNSLSTNLSSSSKNKYRIYYDNLDDGDYISLHFYFNKKLENHPYIIMASPDQYFYKVIKQLCNSAPFLKKEYITAYKFENGKKIEIQTKKTVKDNDLNEKSKILVEFE